MRLIGLALILTVSLVLTPLAIESQQRGTVPRIGIISALTREGQMPLADAKSDPISLDTVSTTMTGAKEVDDGNEQAEADSWQ